MHGASMPTLIGEGGKEVGDKVLRDFDRFTFFFFSRAR